nr:MAG TPA: hypothetical protein [Caudoviricetes sp.]
MINNKLKFRLIVYKESADNFIYYPYDGIISRLL